MFNNLFKKQEEKPSGVLTTLTTKDIDFLKRLHNVLGVVELSEPMLVRLFGRRDMYQQIDTLKWWITRCGPNIKLYKTGVEHIYDLHPYFMYELRSYDRTKQLQHALKDILPTLSNDTVIGIRNLIKQGEHIKTHFMEKDLLAKELEKLSKNPWHVFPKTHPLYTPRRVLEASKEYYTTRYNGWN